MAKDLGRRLGKLEEARPQRGAEEGPAYAPLRAWVLGNLPESLFWIDDKGILRAASDDRPIRNVANVFGLIDELPQGTRGGG